MILIYPDGSKVLVSGNDQHIFSLSLYLSTLCLIIDCSLFNSIRIPWIDCTGLWFYLCFRRIKFSPAIENRPLIIITIKMIIIRHRIFFNCCCCDWSFKKNLSLSGFHHNHHQRTVITWIFILLNAPKYIFIFIKIH